MAEASLDTSVPVIPMATPISAFFRAGASLTPSPVMATTLPFRCHASTILILSDGDTLAYTDMWASLLSSSSSDILLSSCPVTATSPSLYIPICLAMAVAVTLWSPVIITGFIPAPIAVATASTASSLGGSIIATSPVNVYPYSLSMHSFSSSLHSLYANARTLMPFSEKALFCFFIASLSSSVIGLTS